MVIVSKPVRSSSMMPSVRSIFTFIIGVSVGTFWMNPLQQLHQCLNAGQKYVKTPNEVETPTEVETLTIVPSKSPGHIDPVLKKGVENIIEGSPLIIDSCDPSDVPDKYKEIFGDELEVYTPFHEFFAKTMIETCEDCPLGHKWVPYFEAYHDRFKRFRNRDGGVTFLEIGVQSGGSIAMWREYFGSNFTYIGLDINPEVQRFDNADWINIHIGDSGDPDFLTKIRELYPDGVDILLDDGGHTMSQQLNNFKVMTDFVKPDGIFACEDLATSWTRRFGGYKRDVTDPVFLSKTMIGRIHHTIDWLHAGFFNGNALSNSRTSDERPQDLYPEMPEYRSFIKEFKSIHIFNQIVFYERGTYCQVNLRTKGIKIPMSSNTYTGYKLPWDKVLKDLTELLEKDKLTCATK